jgi:hypothetical protein
MVRFRLSERFAIAADNARGAMTSQTEKTEAQLKGFRLLRLPILLIILAQAGCYSFGV